ncbi:MAG: hypothetical protein ACRC5H_02880 [Treponemataceae bacterium]
MHILKTEFTNQNKFFKISLSLIFIIGMCVRILFISEFPMGFDQDEASAGYDAFSILNYGIDRNNNYLPIHLVAWGSGQNALYAYLCMPFIKLFGLTIFAVRLPMALFGLLSLFMMYMLLNQFKDKTFLLWGMFFYAINPWHIMKSRFGLDCNIFPELIFIGVVLLVLSLKDSKKSLFFYFSFFFFALAAYSYGAAYFFLAFFIPISLVFLLYNKKLSFFHAITGFLLFFLLCIPIIIFVIINTFDLPQIETAFFTIPKQVVARHKVTTSFSPDSSSIFLTFFQFFARMLAVIFIQFDGVPANRIPFFGLTYVFSSPFLVLGLIHFVKLNSKQFFKYKSLEDGIFKIFFAWFVVAFCLFFIVRPNIHRVNILFIPMIFFTIHGICRFLEKFPQWNKSLVILYTCAFLSFVTVYFTGYQKYLSKYFFYSFGDAIVFAENLKTNEIYVSNTDVNMPYIFTLFYTKENPHVYYETVEFYNKISDFQQVKSYGKFRFFTPEITVRDGNAHIIKNTDAQVYKNAGFILKEFENYSVAY